MNPLILIVLDGWGLNRKIKGNAVKLANPRNFNKLWKNYPHTKLKAWGEYVGLPKGTLGGSEVGHLHLGAGRIVPQELKRIDDSIKDGSFFKNRQILWVMEKVKRNKSKLHLLGLLSDAGVHSHISHFVALLRMAKRNGIKDVYVHAFLDGRDTPPKSAIKYVRWIEREMKKLGVGKIATLCGRYYAMDRDKRWKRTKKAYDLLTDGLGIFEKDPVTAIRNAYKRGETDEFISPVIIDKNGIIRSDDGVVFVNFRSDRARQLTEALTKKNFRWFRTKKLRIFFVGLAEFEKKLKLRSAFPPLKIKNSFGEWISKLGLKQLRIAETEKYPHVTYFFNCGREKPFKGEDRTVIPSPKVSTYDKKPEMSAYKITRKLIPLIEKYDFILVNFANPDMVGHTGNLKATIKAIKVVDECLGKIVKEAKKHNRIIVVTADHGNAEEMIDYKTGEPKTSHTFNPVPFIVINYNRKIRLEPGGLANVAPTLLELMSLEKPREMIDGLCSKI